MKSSLAKSYKSVNVNMSINNYMNEFPLYLFLTFRNISMKKNTCIEKIVLFQQLDSENI